MTKMTIITKQWFEQRDLLSYKTRVERKKLPELIAYVQKNIDSIGLCAVNDIIFSVEEEVSEPDVSIVNVELLIPVNRNFRSSSRYVFKPVFRLENAVLAKYCGQFDKLDDAHRKLREYLICNRMQPITKVYYVLRSLREDNGVIDMFVGVNGNVS